MHNAPSVTYPVGRFAWAGGILLFLWLVACSVVLTAVYVSGIDSNDWRVALTVVALLWGGGAAHSFWRQLPVQGLLRWDGHHWWLPGVTEDSVDLQVHWQGQRQLLIGLSTSSTPMRWLWLSAADDPILWEALRRAVYSRPVRLAQQDAATP